MYSITLSLNVESKLLLGAAEAVAAEGVAISTHAKKIQRAHARRGGGATNQGLATISLSPR